MSTYIDKFNKKGNQYDIHDARIKDVDLSSYNGQLLTVVDGDVEPKELIGGNGIVVDNSTNHLIGVDISGDVLKIENEKLTADTYTKSSIDTKDTTLQTNIDNEVNTRTTQVNTLTTNLNTEIANRTSADTTLQTNIDTEVTNRTEAINTVDTKIDDTKTTLETTINTVKTELTTTITNVDTKVENIINPPTGSTPIVVAVAEEANKVNGHTVYTDVPVGAVFTDTTYTAGENVQISASNVISATDTTYSNATISNSGLMKHTILNNVSVSSESWVTDSTYTVAEYYYKANITIEGCTDKFMPSIIFDLNDAISGNFAPIAKTDTNTVTIWAKTKPTSSITISTLELTYQG